MATYTTSLNTFTLAQSATGFSELASPHASGAAPASTTENYYQNGNAVDQATGQGDNQDSGFQYYAPSALSPSFASGDVVIGYFIYASPTNLKSWSAGGFRVGVGSSQNNHKMFNAGGNNLAPYPEGGWMSVAIDPEETADQTIGSPTIDTTISDVRALAWLPNVTVKITKGSPTAVDSWRYGTADIIVTGTSSTFTGMGNADGASTAKWGVFQATRGGYLWKGLMTLGTAGASVTFSDSNINIFVDDTPRVPAGFNKVEISNASSSVTWTNVNFIGVETSITGSAPVAPGDFEMVDNATFSMTGGGFTDMGTFIFDTNATLTLVKFLRVGQVTAGAATFTGCAFNNSTSATSLLAGNNDMTDITGNSFTSDGSNHAVEINAVGTGAMTWNNTLTSYVAGTSGNNVTTGSTGNEAIYLNFTSSATYTINVSAGATVPSVRKGTGMTGNVNVIAGAVSVTVNTVNSIGTAVDTRVFVETATGGAGGSLPFEDSVTITKSGTTATVTHTAHGLANGDKVVIRGCDQNFFNGIKTISNVATNTYDYTVSDLSIISATNVITNGTFDADTNWTKTSAWTISGGKANFNDSVTRSMTQDPGAGFASKTWYVKFTVSNYVSGTVRAIVGGADVGTSRTANGTYEEEITAGAGATDVFYIQAINSGEFSIDNVEVREVLTVPTGTIVSSFVFISGTTTSGSVSSTARTLSVDQPIKGKARKSTATPFYKSAPINGTIDATDGLNITSVMIIDE